MCIGIACECLQSAYWLFSGRLNSYVTMWLCGVEMTEYATISVPVEVKRRLEKVKGKKEWGKFLLELYTEAQLLKSKKAFEELVEVLSEEDLETIEESSEEFRENLAFR